MGAVLLDRLLDAGVAPAAHGAWLDDARREAREALVRDGLPGARSEAWKYTSLRAVAQRAYARGDAGAADRAVEASLVALPGVEGPRVVFVNGRFRADLSQLPATAGLTLAPLADVLDDTGVHALLARRFDDASQAFARLNTALVDDGVLVRVAPDAQVDVPVHLVFAGVPAVGDVAWQSRVLVELGEGASLRLIESHVGTDGQAHLGNHVAQVAVRRGATLDLLQMQVAAEAGVLVRRSDIVLDEDARLNLRTLELGGQLVRHDLVVDLAGDRAQLESRGVFALHGRQHVDTHLDIRHLARDTRSDLVWRGVADARSRGVFHGAITVAPGADGTDASLANKNLLLSDQAEIDTQPLLVIHADEVKAAHGATVGQLDERALFYLRSRGLPESEARALLTLAFCRVAIESLENAALRDHIDAVLLDHLPRDVVAPGAQDAPNRP